MSNNIFSVDARYIRYENLLFLPDKIISSATIRDYSKNGRNKEVQYLIYKQILLILSFNF